MSEPTKNFVVPVIEIDGDLAIEFPDELMDTVGWKIGDVIEWHIESDGSCVLRAYTPVNKEKK